MCACVHAIWKVPSVFRGAPPFCSPVPSHPTIRYGQQLQSSPQPVLLLLFICFILFPFPLYNVFFQPLSSYQESYSSPAPASAGLKGKKTLFPRPFSSRPPPASASPNPVTPPIVFSIHYWRLLCCSHFVLFPLLLSVFRVGNCRTRLLSYVAAFLPTSFRLDNAPSSETNAHR